MWRALPGQARQQPLPFRRLLAEPGPGFVRPHIPYVPRWVTEAALRRLCRVNRHGEVVPCGTRRLGFFHSSGSELKKRPNESQAQRFVRIQ